MRYRSTAVRPQGEGFLFEGELSLHGVTRQVELQVDLNRFTKDPYGGTRAGFTATTSIDRRDFGITPDVSLDGGGLVVGEAIKIFIKTRPSLPNLCLRRLPRKRRRPSHP